MVLGFEPLFDMIFPGSPMEYFDCLTKLNPGKGAESEQHWIAFENKWRFKKMSCAIL